MNATYFNDRPTAAQLSSTARPADVLSGAQERAEPTWACSALIANGG
jgi:hypothetical protein